jgi:hypothetical protein
MAFGTRRLLEFAFVAFLTFPTSEALAGGGVYHRWSVPIAETTGCPTALDLDILSNILRIGDVDAATSLYWSHYCRAFGPGSLGYVTHRMPGTDYVCFRPEGEYACYWVPAYALRETAYP